MTEIEAVELVPDLEEEDAEHEHRHEHVQRDAQFDHHRHAVARAHRSEEQAIFHRQEADDLRDRLAPRHHRQEGEQHDRHRDAERAARGRGRQRRDRLRDTEGEDDDEQADQHRARDVQHRLGIPVDAEPADQPVQDQWHPDDLERERERGRDVQMRLRRTRRRAAAWRAQSSAPWKARRSTSVTMRRCESIAKDTSSSSAAQEIEELQIEAGYGHGLVRAPQARSNWWTRSPSTANRNAVARNSGARNTRTFADTVSISARRDARERKLEHECAAARAQCRAGRCRSRSPTAGTARNRCRCS